MLSKHVEGHKSRAELILERSHGQVHTSRTFPTNARTNYISVHCLGGLSSCAWTGVAWFGRGRKFDCSCVDACLLPPLLVGTLLGPLGLYVPDWHTARLR